MYPCVSGKSIPHGTRPVYYNFAGTQPACFVQLLKLPKQGYRNEGGKLIFLSFSGFQFIKTFLNYYMFSGKSLLIQKNTNKAKFSIVHVQEQQLLPLQLSISSTIVTITAEHFQCFICEFTYEVEQQGFPFKRACLPLANVCLNCFSLN